MSQIIQCRVLKEEVHMFPPTTTSFPLLLKLAAAAITGATAFLALRRIQRDEAVSSLRRDVFDALLLLRRHDDSSSATAPPTILVTGFRGHGKSSFINTACRALAAERGPLLLRAETAPPGPRGNVNGGRVVRALVRASPDDRDDDDEDEAAPAVDFVDALPLPEHTSMTKAEAEAAFANGHGVTPTVECVILVIRAGGHMKERNVAVKKLTDVARAFHDQGLHLMVVVTHKKDVKSRRQAEDLRREIAFRARTDCVYFIENYTTGNMLDVRRPPTVKNDFETHLTAPTVVRQCAEFAKSHRRYLAARPVPVTDVGRTGGATT